MGQARLGHHLGQLGVVHVTRTGLGSPEQPEPFIELEEADFSQGATAARVGRDSRHVDVQDPPELFLSGRSIRVPGQDVLDEEARVP